MRLLVLTLEFTASTFSGNGIYCQSQVRALARLGHQVLVISGKPSGWDQPPRMEGAEQLIEVELPVWNRLDRGSGWQALAAGAAREEVVETVARFSPVAALGVDWSSLPPYRALAAALLNWGLPPPRYVCLVYRVFLRGAEAADSAFMREMEAAAAAEAAAVAVLSRSDAEYMEAHLREEGAARLGAKVLLPALRSDMMRVPAPPPAADGARCFLSCCVRLSPEKEPERFVALVEALAAAGALAAGGAGGVVPLMCGSADSDYARALKARLRAAAPGAVVEERFLGPDGLAEVYSRTLLNFHPCTYDAYGMTIVEAASQGAPSLVQAGGTVGATDLLREGEGEVLTADLGVSPAALAAHVAALLADRPLLGRVGGAACSRARGWGEEANAQELAGMVADALML